MKRKDIVRQIKSEAAENTPDNYNSILSAALSQGLLNENETSPEVYGNGEAVMAKRKNRILAGALSCFAVVLLALVITFSLVFGGGGGAGSAPISIKLSATDSYGVGAVSTVKLLGNSMSAEAVKTLARASICASEDNISVKDEVETFHRYFSALDSFFGDDIIKTETQENTETSKYPYETKLTITGMDLNGNAQVYVMYYTETVEKQKSDGDKVKAEYTLSGVMVQDGEEFYLEGERKSEIKDGETEQELKICAYADRNNKRNYIEMKQETEDEANESEAEYVYGIYSDGKLVEETAVKFETERKKGKEQTEYELEFRQGKSKGKYEIKREVSDGDTKIKVKYDIGGSKGEFTVNETVSGNGDKQYEYTFSDGSKTTIKSDGKIK